MSVARAFPEQGLWQLQPLLWAELSPKAVGQEDALLAPLGPVPPTTSHPNSMLESQPVNALGRKKTGRHLDCKALRPAQHHSLGSINRESSVLPALAAPGLKDYVHPLGEIVPLQSNTKNIYKSRQTCNKIKICGESVHFYSFCTR